MINKIDPRMKNPKRISVVIRQDVLADIQYLAEWQGRSVSNMCAYLLEQAIKENTVVNKPAILSNLSSTA